MLSPLLVDALPHPGFGPAAFRIVPADPTHFVHGGDAIDLGGRTLSVVDQPGHTPGSIGLLEDGEGALLSGGAVYEGKLIDTLPESDVGTYVGAMERLRELEVDVVYPGHDWPFGRERLRELAARTCASAAADAAGGAGRRRRSRPPLPAREQRHRHAGEGHAHDVHAREPLAQDEQPEQRRHGAVLRDHHPGDGDGADADRRGERPERGGVEDPGKRRTARQGTRQPKSGEQERDGNEHDHRAEPAVGGQRQRVQRARLDEEQHGDREERRREQRPGGAGGGAGPAGRRWRAGRPARAAPGAPRTRGALVRPNTSSFGTFSTDAIKPPATANGSPTRANAGSGSPPAIMITATKPPANDASGVTTDRLPVTRPRSRQPSPAASQTPLAVAKATARHSAAPLGGPSMTSASGSRMTRPMPIDHVSVVQTAAARTTLTIRKSCRA